VGNADGEGQQRMIRWWPWGGAGRSWAAGARGEGGTRPRRPRPHGAAPIAVVLVIASLGPDLAPSILPTSQPLAAQSRRKGNERMTDSHNEALK